MLIAIDWDFTITADGYFFENLIDLIRRRNHNAIIVTSRSKFTGISREEFHKYLPACSYEETVIVYSNTKYKRTACMEAGYSPDIWIDDMPEVIGEICNLSHLIER